MEVVVLLDREDGFPGQFFTPDAFLVGESMFRREHELNRLSETEARHSDWLDPQAAES